MRKQDVTAEITSTEPEIVLDSGPDDDAFGMIGTTGPVRKQPSHYITECDR